ncbi:TetR family transcriptional regulator [Azospirillum agricola]|uniref:TetR family transcriptional regulator n=1 Tax=Azospirillum agricola TaxID=1720247 RepID=UPI000A0F3107|nr:TetR family transcriptional regulator [Azospirillum agricola]SMH62646.1 transcriptional regulator, TetR family [Azospirillum lipoferum]
MDSLTDPAHPAPTQPGTAQAATPPPAPSPVKVTRDPEGTRARILAAATEEFARYGLGGARVDRIAEAAGTNKRMLYYHVGNKESLYLAVLEGAYEHIRATERQLSLETLNPPDAIARLIGFTWQYFIDHPEFMALLNIENLHRAELLKDSDKVPSMHSPFVQLIADVLERGVAQGIFRAGVDPVQLYISIAGLSYFYLSNVHTLSVIFRRDLMAEPEKAARLAHMVELVLQSLRA